MDLGKEKKLTIEERANKVPTDCWDCFFGYYDNDANDFKCSIRYCKFEKEMREREDK